jgi:micrococcal nuclease
VEKLKVYKIKIIAIIFIIIFCTLAVNFQNRPVKIKEDTAYKVANVYDGDTFSIEIANKIQKVRMLGIDTPETVDPRKSVQCFGLEASKKTKELLEKHAVTLKTDPTQGVFDKYHRVLAYVYRDDGLFVNKYLLENGYAHEYTYNIPYEKQREFKDFQSLAREGKIGLWGNICNE